MNEIVLKCDCTEWLKGMPWEKLSNLDLGSSKLLAHIDIDRLNAMTVNVGDDYTKLLEALGDNLVKLTNPALIAQISVKALNKITPTYDCIEWLKGIPLEKLMDPNLNNSRLIARISAEQLDGIQVKTKDSPTKYTKLLDAIDQKTLTRLTNRSLIAQISAQKLNEITVDKFCDYVNFLNLLTDKQLSQLQNRELIGNLSLPRLNAIKEPLDYTVMLDTLSAQLNDEQVKQLRALTRIKEHWQDKPILAE